MIEGRQMRFGNRWSRSILMIDFIFCVFYIADPFKWIMGNFKEYFGIIVPIIIIGLWFLSSSLKSTVTYNPPANRAEKICLKKSYYAAIASAILIIGGSLLLFFAESNTMKIIGTIAVLIGLILQMLADRYFLPFISYS